MQDLSSLSDDFGILAGVFQFVAYLVYIRYFLKDAIRPNAVSWIMFAYGTAFMLFLEWQGGASWDLLVLPFVCAIMSVFVAVMCLKSSTAMPTTNLERGVFAADLGLTLGYLGLNAVTLTGPLVKIGFIVTGNLTAITAFVPILVSTWKQPDNEKTAPWMFWAIAYAFLVLATLLAKGFSAPELLIYPVLGVAIHGGMALIITMKPKIDRGTMRNEENVSVAKSNIAGLGIFAAKPYATNEPVIILTGPRITRPGTAGEGPNWVGIDKDDWIDPEYPVCYLNHSCDPNAAFSEGLLLRALRPIAQDEEITMDYSTTEADLTWRMTCACGVPACRKVLTSIQTAFKDAAQPPAAIPAMQAIWRAHHHGLYQEIEHVPVSIPQTSQSELV